MGPADHLAVNPHHPGGAAMRLYQTVRIEQIEAIDEFISAREIADRRREAAKKGLQTKTQNAAETASKNIPAPILPAAPRPEFVQAAVNWHNPIETWRAGSGQWISVEDPDTVLFPIIIDFIRDRLKNYRQLARPIGISVEAAAAAGDRKIMETIAIVYPWLGIGENGNTSVKGQPEIVEPEGIVRERFSS